MKRKWIVLPLSLACVFTAIGAAACDKEPTEDETKVPDYTFEDYKPEMADPDEGFKIDGVLDESVYAEKTWLRAVKMEKLDEFLDYDAAKAEIEKAAKIGMTTHYGTEGMYVAIEYVAAEGEQLYVNPDRSSTQNSIAELYLAMPQGQDIEDKYVCEIDLGPDGSMVFKKNNWGGNWDTFATTNDIMAQLGVQTNGQVGQFIDEGQQRATEYTMELFIPWGYIDKIGGEGTAKLIQEGDVRMNLAPITSYNYTGTDGDVDRWWWMLGSQLDDGAWGNLNGWYHFDSDGLKAYNIDIEVKNEGGDVMERFGYDQAVANNSVTFLTYADETHAIKSVKVNGVEYVEKTSAIGNGSFTVPASEVTKDLKVEVEFMDYTPEAVEYTLNVKLTRFGVTTQAPAGTKIKLTGLQNYDFTVGENGVAKANVLPGTYTATIESVEGETKYLDTRVLLRINAEEEPVDVTFGNDAFTQALFGDWAGTTIDDSNAYGKNGYFTNTGNSVMAISNETFMDSVFTLKMSKNTKGGNFAGIGLFFEKGDGANAIRLEMGVQNGKIDVQLGARDDGAIPHITPVGYEGDVWHWFNFDTDGSYTTAWNNGTSLAFTVVRDGATLYLFIAIDGDADSLKYFGKCTIPEEYASQEGHWGVIVADAPNATHYIALDDTAEGVAEWVDLTTYSVKLPANLENGSVSADKTTAEVSETITVTITPNSGYSISEVLVNGQPAQLTDGKLVLSYDGVKEITVEVTFRVASIVDVELTVPAIARLGESVDMNGKVLIFKGSATSQEFTVANGKVDAELEKGVTYTVVPADFTGAVAAITVAVADDGTFTVDGKEATSLNFVYDAFAGNTVGNPTGGTTDDSKTNEEGTVSANGKFWTLMNEKTNASVFTVTVKLSDLADGSVYFGYLFSDNKGILAQLDVQRTDGAFTGLNLQWRMWSGDYIPDSNILNIGWGGAATTEFNEAFQGDGVDITIVRAADGKTFYMFLSAHGDDDLSLRTWKNIPDEYATQTGVWAFGADNSKAEAKYAVGLETDAQTVADTIEQAYLNVSVSKAEGEVNNHGEITASAEKVLTTDGSITVTVSTDIGYVIDKLLVNGVDRAADLEGGKLSFTVADGKTITVVASFKEATTANIEATVTGNRLGEITALENGTELLFEGVSSGKLTVKDGKVTGELNIGEEYLVTVVGKAYLPLNAKVEEGGKLTVTGGTDNTLAFAYDMFQTGADGVGNMTDIVIDDTHANEDDGYIINKHHNTVFANTTDTFGDSVFTVNFKNSQATKNNRWGIEYIVIVNGVEYGLRATLKVGTDAGFENKLVFQWYGEGNPDWGWGVSNMNNSWTNIVVETTAYNNDAYKEAFLNGEGIDFTVVRSGNEVHYFMAIHGKADSVFYCDSFTLTGDYTQEGYWTIAIADAKQDEQIHFALSDKAEDVAAWVAKVPTQE